MDDTDMPCKDLPASKQKRPEKGRSSIQEIGKDGYDHALNAAKEGPENGAVKETEIESKSGSTNKSQGCELGEKVYSQQTLEVKVSRQVSEGEEDFNGLEIGSAVALFNNTILDDFTCNEKYITLKKPDCGTSSYKSCKDKKNEVVAYSNLKANQLPQGGYKPALIDQTPLVSQSQPNLEVNRSSQKLQPCDDSDPHRQNREELLKTPCEQIQSEEFIEKNDQNSTVHPPKNVIKDVKEDRGCASRFAERDFTADCFTEIKVKDGSCLQIGQHLTMPGWYLRKVYRHNAILYAVVSCQGQFVELELLHFTKRNGRTDIFKTTKKYDLGTADLRIVVCQYQKYTPNEIIQRAESMLGGVASEKYKKYNLFTNNCEHFAMWCAVGMNKSFQVKKFQDIMKISVACIVLHYFSSGLNFVS